MIDKIKHDCTGNFEEDRKKIKDEVVDLFKSEKAGQGKGNLATRVVYCVEQTGDELIYLKRPAPLNKGFDFEVHLNKKFFFKKQKSRPSHDCIITILKNLKQENIDTNFIKTYIYNAIIPPISFILLIIILFLNVRIHNRISRVSLFMAISLFSAILIWGIFLLVRKMALSGIISADVVFLTPFFLLLGISVYYFRKI